MTVKELISMLLDEKMDAKVMIEVTKDGKETGKLFDIKNVTHWAYMPLLMVEDWRKE